MTIIAEQALERATGARGLRAILEEVLLDVMYELPGDETAGVAVPCPDCPGSMTEEFSWDSVAA